MEFGLGFRKANRRSCYCIDQKTLGFLHTYMAVSQSGLRNCALICVATSLNLLKSKADFQLCVRWEIKGM